MSASSQDVLLNHWWQRVGTHRRRVTTARPFAALSFSACAPVCGGLVPLDKIVAVVCYDELLPNGQIALRLRVCSPLVQRESVVWGGELGTTELKDLRLMPAVKASALRVDLNQPWLLRTGLGLEREIHLRSCRGVMPNRQAFAMPRLWAGFRPFDAVQVRGDGAELDAEARNRMLRSETVLRLATRAQGELVVFPHGWVGADRQLAVGLFADLRGLPRCQVIALNSPVNLAGTTSSGSFDFLRPWAWDQVSRPSRPVDGPEKFSYESCA